MFVGVLDPQGKPGRNRCPLPRTRTPQKRVSSPPNLRSGVAQLKVEESARTAARAAARGDSEAQIRSAVSRIDPAQSVQISVSSDSAVDAGEGRARQVHVRVSRPAPGVVGSATGWVLRADAHARVESSGENDAENGAGHENE